MTTREQVMAALFARLDQAHDFKTSGRRNTDPESLLPASTPALFVLEHLEEYRAAHDGKPAVRRLMPVAIVYTDVGTDLNAVPATTINFILDRIDDLLKPDDPVTRLCTLGGLVKSVVIAGRLVKTPGEKTSKSVAVVPLDILLP